VQRLAWQAVLASGCWAAQLVKADEEMLHLLCSKANTARFVELAAGCAINAFAAEQWQLDIEQNDTELMQLCESIQEHATDSQRAWIRSRAQSAAFDLLCAHRQQRVAEYLGLDLDQDKALQEQQLLWAPAGPAAGAAAGRGPADDRGRQCRAAASDIAAAHPAAHTASTAKRTAVERQPLSHRAVSAAWSPKQLMRVGSLPCGELSHLLVTIRHERRCCLRPIASAELNAGTSRSNACSPVDW